MSPDYIVTTKEFAPKLVRIFKCDLSDIYALVCLFVYLWCHLLQVDAMKLQLEKFYGEDPLKSDNLSRIVSSNHYARITNLLDDPKVSDKIIHGGQRDSINL